MGTDQITNSLDETQERWLPILGFPGYDVSDQGRVRSYWKCSGGQPRGGQTIAASPRRILKPGFRNGYRSVVLMLDGQRHNQLVHRLVLLTFVGPCPAGQEARHRNGIRIDCSLSNLMWGTHSENILDKIQHGTLHDSKGMNHPCRKLDDKQVLKIRELYAQGTYSQRSIAQLFDINQSAVHKIIHRHRWTHI